LLLVIHSM